MRLIKLGFLAAALTLTMACGGDDGGDGDGDGDGDADSGGNNTDPAAAFTMTPDCTNSSADEITFESTSTDADGDTLTCSWTFNSGNPSSGSECTVTGVRFPNAAPYQITLNVDDGNGGTSSAQMFLDPC